MNIVLVLVKPTVLTTKMHVVASDLSSEQTHHHHLVRRPTVEHKQ